jgi:Uma2 family endonuclease
MPAELTKKRFTVDEYYRMAEAGILKPEDRLELIDGEVIEMSPIGNKHAGRVNRAADLFMNVFRGKATVAVQNPVRLDQYNELQPDLVLARLDPDYYASRHPAADDVILVFEVADTSLRRDRDIKLPIYAMLGIPEVWIEDLKYDEILIFRNPIRDQYDTSLTVRRGESLSVAAFPDIVLNAETVLGPD